jgi:hypothetical protein
LRENKAGKRGVAGVTGVAGVQEHPTGRRVKI